MKKTILMLGGMMLFLTGCPKKQQAVETGDREIKKDTLMWNGYRKTEPTEISDNMVRMLSEDWMLITAGNKDSYNTMTASWGGIGFVWNKPVTFITVRNVRYTYRFLQENDHYTLSFFGGGEKDALNYLGSHSGRDGDKVAATNLTPLETPAGSMAFEQATMIIECRKLFEDKLDPKSIFDDEIATWYIQSNDHHVLFIGEIVNVWVREARQ